MHMQQSTKSVHPVTKASSMATSGSASNNGSSTASGNATASVAASATNSDSSDANGPTSGSIGSNLVLTKQSLTKGPQTTNATNATTIIPAVSTGSTTSNSGSAAQVITVVSPTSTAAQPHATHGGQPVVVQVANNTQFIALAVPSEQVNPQTNNHSNVSNSNAADVEEQSTNFEEFTTNNYTNGNNSTLTYYTTDSSFNSTSGYFNSSSVGQLLSDGTYLVMEQADGQAITPTLSKSHGDSPPNEEDMKQIILQQQQRISVQPQTVKWLLDNYESADGVSLPRSTLYAHYLEHCHQHSIDAVNAASFGKLIRSVFIGLRTRRLGTRGNSKYHYYGIRIKPGSSLANSLMVFEGSAASSPGAPPEKRPKLTSGNGNTSNPKTSTPGIYSLNNGQGAPPGITLSVTASNDLKSYLGDPSAILPSVWPEEPTIPSNETDSPGALLNRFAFCYRKHYEQVINAIGTLQFNLVEQLWTNFWQAKTLTGEKQHLTLEQLHQLTIPSLPPDEGGEEEAFNSLANWIIQTDYTLYNSFISSLLLPNLLKPIPQQLAVQIRNFAKNMVNWMSQSLAGYDPGFVSLKCSAVSAFSHTLRRYTSLNHLSSAARTVLQNYQQVQQMISDLNKVDFRNVQEQASWACRCDDQVVKDIEQSFKSLLQENTPSEKWPLWCDQIIDLCLRENIDAKASTQFFFNWIFYSSLVMRDLTLRSAGSFGSFHLIRLLFDEYIFYLIEHRVAKASNKTPLQVLQEF